MTNNIVNILHFAWHARWHGKSEIAFQINGIANKIAFQINGIANQISIT